MSVVKMIQNISEKNIFYIMKMAHKTQFSLSKNLFSKKKIN